ncbi:uncharacterized protein LOC119184640 isoform X2 [Rhipicephalus microplus]|uniref:uncharacterized protein LOC119184640 isoform X2 n=1 Tax=Rhipicephalus microplus TaxID=6941 RepID=UPI003F6C51FE
MGRYGKWVRYMHNCGRPQYSPGLPGRLDHGAARGDRGWRPQHWKLRNVPRNLRTVMMLVSSVGPTVLPKKSSEQPDPRIPCPQRDFNWNETRHSSVQGKDPANFQQLSWGTRKPRRHKPRAHSTSLEKIGEPGFGKQEVHVTAASGSHLAEKGPATAVNTHTLVVECGTVKAPDGEGAATTAIESFRVDKQYLPEPTEDCAMRDDYTGPAKPQTQDKQCHSLASNTSQGSPTGKPVTKIGSSFEDLRYYKIPKIKQQVPSTKEHCSDISRTCPSLVDEIIKDMDKAYPKISGCYVSGSNYCPHRNQVNEMPKSPAKCPLEDNRSLSKSANIDCAPVSSQIKQKKQMKICTVCKRKNVSERVGQGTCVRCSLYEEINNEQAAMKEQGRKQRLAVCEPVTPAELSARRSSSDVENKEMVAKIPTRPRSRSKSKSRTSNIDTVGSAALQANEHESIFKKRKRKTCCLTKPIISSSDHSSSSEDDVCVVAASAGSASLPLSEQARPQRKCRALSESPQNMRGEPPRKGIGEISEKPLTTGSKNGKAEAKLQRSQSKTAKPKAQLNKCKGSEEEKQRRLVMRKAWRKAKDTDDYLTTLGELEKCTKRRKTLCTIAKESEKPEECKTRSGGHTDAKRALGEHEQLQSVKGECTDGKSAIEECEQLEKVTGDHALGEREQPKSVKGDCTDGKRTIEEHEQLERVRGDHTGVKPTAFGEHEQPKRVKGDCTDGKRAIEEHEQLERVRGDRIGVKPTLEEREQIESAKGDCTEAKEAFEKREQLANLNGDHADAEPQLEEHEQFKSNKGDHTELAHASESASAKQSGEVAIDMCRLAADSLVLASSPALVVASCCSLSLTDWESMANDSDNSINSEVVRSVVTKVTPAYSLPSDRPLSDVHASTSFRKCAEKAVLPSAVVTDPSTVTFNEKPVDAAVKCPMRLPFLLSFEDDGTMSVTIRDSDCVSNQEKGFPTNEVGGLGLQPQEVGPSSSSDADYVSAFIASLQESDFNLNQGQAVRKSHLDKEHALTDTHTKKTGTKKKRTKAEEPSSSKQEEPDALSTFALQPLPCLNSDSEITADTAAPSGCDDLLSSRVAQLHLDSLHTVSSCVHPTQVNSQRFRNALLQNFRDSSDTAKSVRSLAGNMDSSGSNASLDIVSLVDTVLVISKDAIGTTDKGHAGQGGVLCQLLDEYVKNIEGFLMSLSECAPSYRDKLVSALLPHGIVGLKTIIQLVWKMEAELQFLGRDRVSDLDKGIFSLLMEQADSLSKTTTEQDLPAFMTIEACIEPQLPTLADPPGEPVADDEQRTNCNDVLEHRTKSNPAADVTSEAVGQLGRAEASPVSVASSVDFCATENSDDDEIIIVDDADHEGLMTDALTASPQGTLTGVQRNRIQRLGSISGLRQPSKTVPGKDEIASQPKSLRAGTVDVAVQGTAHTAAAVDVPPVEQGQLSTGITCPPHAATGIVQNRIFDKPLTGKPKNLDAASSAKVSRVVNAKEAPRVPTDTAVAVAATQINSSDKYSLTGKPKNLDAASSAKVSRVVNAKEAPRVPTDTAVAVAATQINSSDKYRLPFTEKTVECRQQRWDQGPKMAPSVNQHSVLYAGMELDLSMQGRQQPDRSALRSPLGCRPRGNVSDTCSTAQHSTQAPKRKVAKVSSQQAILQGVLSSQSSRQGQLAYSAAGKPQQGRQVNVELRDPSQLIYTGPQHTGQNEMASVQQSVMSSRQREELAKQIAWMSANAHTFPRNLQGSAGPPDWVRRTVLSDDASRPAHAQSFSPQSDLLQGSSNAHAQLQEREPCLLQQHERGQQYAANTNASSFLPSPSASYGFRAVPMDTALIEVEKEVLDRLQMQSYLDQIVHKVKAGKAAPVQQPGHSEALKQRQLSQRELLLRQQINNALHAFAISAPQKAQQWHFRAYQSYQRPLQDPTVELSCDSSAQARVDRNNSSAGISQESTSSESPVGFVRPWTAQSKQPKPYSACQDTLQRWKNRQLDGAPKSGLPEDAAEQILDEYRVDANAHPRQTTEAQNHVFMHQVFLPEPNRNTAHCDISNHTPVPHTSVSGRKRNIGARSKVSSSALVQQEVSGPQQSPNSMARSGVPGRAYRERSTSTWHPPTSIHDPPA